MWRRCLKWIYSAYWDGNHHRAQNKQCTYTSKQSYWQQENIVMRGVAEEDRQNGSGLIKAAIWAPFIALAGVWRRHRAPLRFCAQKQFISSDLQTHTQEYTPGLSVSTPPSDLLSLGQQDACCPLWQSHTHNESTLQTLQPTELRVHVRLDLPFDRVHATNW